MKKMERRILCAVFAAVFVIVFSAAANASAFPKQYRTDAETPVLHQKNNPLCWAYAGSDQLSINAIKTGQASSGASVFSAPMMARAEYDGGEHRHSRGNVWYKCYGSFDYALMAGISGKGLLYDTDYPTIESADAAPVSALYAHSAYIDRFLMTDTLELTRKERTEKFKQWITEYGAVCADVFIGNYNTVTKIAETLTYDSSKAAHQILLVGWDDEKYTDTGTGAFLMKNTWGESWGDGGYAWISYNTEFGRSAFAASVRLDADARVMTHTEVDYGSGNHTTDNFRFGAVNVFGITEKMTLRYAGVYTGQKNSELEARVYLNLKQASDLLTASAAATAKETVTDSGYYTLSLSRELNVSPGDTVTVLYIVHANGNYYVYSEYSDPDFEMTVISSQPGQSYLLKGDELVAPKGDYIGTLIGFAEHREQPPAQTTAAETTAPAADTGSVTDEETDPDTN